MTSGVHSPSLTLEDVQGAEEEYVFLLMECLRAVLAGKGEGRGGRGRGERGRGERGRGREREGKGEGGEGRGRGREREGKGEGLREDRRERMRKGRQGWEGKPWDACRDVFWD